MKTYRYVDGEFEVRIEIKRSIFIATVKGELNADEADEFVKSVRKKYPDATHNCYAYVGDELGNVTRFSDDGERPVRQDNPFWMYFANKTSSKPQSS